MCHYHLYLWDQFHELWVISFRNVVCQGFKSVVKIPYFRIKVAVNPGLLKVVENFLLKLDKCFVVRWVLVHGKFTKPIKNWLDDILGKKGDSNEASDQIFQLLVPVVMPRHAQVLDLAPDCLDLANKSKINLLIAWSWRFCWWNKLVLLKTKHE